MAIDELHYISARALTWLPPWALELGLAARRSAPTTARWSTSRSSCEDEATTMAIELEFELFPAGLDLLPPPARVLNISL
jgi:hypothetical protein